jgi:RNA polymerase sigma-70 factor (ECF subfamily)
MLRRTRDAGEKARRRVEILRLRFEDDLPIRKIARLWDEEPAGIHREYARARREYEAALLEVLSAGKSGTKATVEECRRLLSLLD